MKKLIVLATLAALPAVALADVTISGDLGVSIVNTNNKDGDKTSENAMNRQTGQIVFSGSDDLGNGLKAIWQVANRIDGSGDESNSWGGRDTFVGLQSEFGKIRFGKLSNPTNSGYSRLEPFNEISIHGDGVGALGEARTANTIRFDSANYAGFEFAVSGQMKPEADATVGDGVAEYTSGLGLKYSNGPIKLVYSYAHFQDQDLFAETSAANTKTRVHTASAEYALGDLTLGLGYASAKASDNAGSFTKESGWGLTATYAMGNLTPKVSYWKEGKLSDETGATDGSYRVVSVGADYALSKRTSVGAEFQFQSARKDLATGDKSGKKNISAVYLTTAF